jgi:hypothetical protein
MQRGLPLCVPALAWWRKSPRDRFNCDPGTRIDHQDTIRFVDIAVDWHGRGRAHRDRGRNGRALDRTGPYWPKECGHLIARGPPDPHN